MPLLLLIARRLALGVLTILVISAVVFTMTEVLPGDVASAILGQAATESALAALREELGLDRPALTRYFAWLGNMLSGDFGQSLVRGAPVADLIVARGQTTLLISGLTIAITVPLAIALGLVAAFGPDGLADRTISSICLIGISLPEFLVALLLVSLFSIYLGWLPATVNLRLDGGLAETIRMLILPVAALTITNLAHMSRMTRTAVVNVLRSPAIEMAILKGVDARRVLLRHALPNAAGPIANVVALEIAHLITGIVMLEVMFNINGLGRLMVEAVAGRDLPVVQACALIFCGIYIVLNLLADLVAIVANPRIRHPK